MAVLENGEEPGRVNSVDAGVIGRKQARQVPDGAIVEPLDHVISPDGFIPRQLALLSNALVWRESRELRAKVGLATNDWRVLAAVASKPGMSSSDISDFLTVNKAGVSQSVNTLLDRDLMVAGDGARGSRTLFLKQAGVEMHEAMRPISERGEEIILEGMTKQEVQAFTVTLQQMLARIRSAS
jgi:DNA-binding MarR family transcriptional regulator